MKKILLLQSVALAVAALIGALLSGINGLWSALAGGLCYLLPSAAAVLLLRLFKPHPAMAGKGFLIGEGLKVALSLLLMLAVFLIWHQSLAFIPFLLGLFAVSHLVFLAFLRVQHYGK
ncbi:ATP synthase subunit I [Uruburuella testudinis]|uniref:ATP synthase subunit I n=1 Tax=Uruburuella testudinis TaxID=1282863 RepID=A0ABY4DSP2_9NEIS|nr:ATP synthase subunit I [Uruburuella testudinis]UOO82055.1 ATP synthase subunit I [Uruburuella testudinis]